MLEYIDPELEWTYLDPALEHPTPQVCHGRQELEQVLRRGAEHGRRAELEEVISAGELVMVGARIPGIDAHFGRVGMTAPTACSRCARDGSSPCATAATGTRPSRLPESGREPPQRLVLVGFGNYVTSASKRALLAGEPEPGRCMLEVTWDRWRDGAEPRWPRSSNSPGYRSPWPCSRSAVTALIVASDPEVRLRLHPSSTAGRVIDLCPRLAR
jgi:hypothetical protein